MEWNEFDTRLAAYAVIVDERDNILLSLWNVGRTDSSGTVDRRLWTMPGGGVHLDETPEQAAIREVREETGYGVVLDGVLGVDTVVVPAVERLSVAYRPLKGFRMLFAAHVTSGVLTKEVGGSTDEARWIPLSLVSGLDRVELVDTSIAVWRSWRRTPLLVVLAGLPGTGKTTLARRLSADLRAAYLRVDAVETVLRRHGTEEPGVIGYAVAYEIAAGTLAAGVPVVIDAVNPVPEARAGWRDLAESTGADLRVFETVVPDQALHRERVRSRQPDLPDQRVPTWEEVVSRQYLPWDEARDGPRVVIDMTRTEDGVETALRAVRDVPT